MMVKILSIIREKCDFKGLNYGLVDFRVKF